MLHQGAVSKAITDLTEKWEHIGLEIGDFPLAGNVRDGVKLEVREQGKEIQSVCKSKSSLFAGFGEHVTRIHELRWAAREHNQELAEEQTEQFLRVNGTIRQYVAECKEAGDDWRDSLHDLMEERYGPAPGDRISDSSDPHICTGLPCVTDAVETVYSNPDAVRSYFGNSLGYFLNENFSDGEEELKSRYLKELLVIGVYIGPVAESEIRVPAWAFHLKGRALQHVHAMFGDPQVADDDRYLAF